MARGIHRFSSSLYTDSQGLETAAFKSASGSCEHFNLNAFIATREENCDACRRKTLEQKKKFVADI